PHIGQGFNQEKEANLFPSLDANSFKKTLLIQIDDLNEHLFRQSIYYITDINHMTVKEMN
ncbi:MAG TPA: hypothetical protein VF360_06200, partial [Candidatus Methanoperedens sp.]